MLVMLVATEQVAWKTDTTRAVVDEGPLIIESDRLGLDPTYELCDLGKCSVSLGLNFLF